VSLATPALAALVATIAWGAFTFGAVYPWGYWPLAIAAQIIAVIGLCCRVPAGWRPLGLSALAAALAALVLGGAVQLIPLSQPALDRLSPKARTVIAQLEPGANLQPEAPHPLSIAPRQTRDGLAVMASLALLVVGLSRLLSISGARNLARAITIVGVLLALAGIIQQSTFTGKIYGFWTPRLGGSPYGPFINKNHFAGWMLMGLPVTLSFVCADMARGLGGVRRGWRDRILWLSSPEASGLLLHAAAAAVMALSLILTMSRSGMVAAACALLSIGVLLLRRSATWGKRVGVMAVLALIPLLVVARVGADTIAARFASADVNDLNGRLGPWQDAIRIARRYPLTGTGLNTYGTATLFYQEFNPTVHYAQAHNDYLELAAEGGLLVSVPAAACLICIVIGIRRRFTQETSETAYWIRTGATTGLAAIAMQEVVDFSLQMPGNALLFVVLCAIALHRAPIRPGRVMRTAAA
jgi:O-antigen ligase